MRFFLKQLRAALAKTRANANPDIFYFLKEVSEVLPPPRALLLSYARQRPQAEQKTDKTVKRSKIS
jgi:hypothetical protein